MKNTTIVLAALSLLLSTDAVAQKMQASSATSVPRNGERIIPAPPVVPLPGKVPATQGLQGAESHRTANAEYSRKKAREENLLIEQKVSPQLKNADGVIRIDFGVARQGESFTTFFTFNITTLENVETVTTPTLGFNDYERYSKLSAGSNITDVKLVSGTLLGRKTQSPINGNGFDIVYTATKPGAVDEWVEVYTKKGNLVFRLTGYVATESTEMSMK